MKKWIIENAKVFSNVGYLGVIQFLSIAFPLVTYPYLIDILGSEGYGSFVYAQSVAMLLAIFVSYGFNLSGTRTVAENIENINKVNITYTSITICKLIFMFLVILLYLVYINNYVPEKERIIYLLCIGPIIYEACTPTWLFQGVQELKILSILTVLHKFLVLSATFIFINEKADLTLYAYITLAYNISISIFSNVVASRKLGVDFSNISFSNIVEVIKQGYYIFVTNIFIAIKDKINVILVGMIFNNHLVVVYDLSAKILGVISIPQNIIITAFYPQIAKNKSKHSIYLVLIMVFGLSLISIISINYFLVDVRNYLFTSISDENLIIIRLLSISAILVSVSSVLARLVFLVFGHEKLLSKLVLFNAIYYLGIMLCSIYIFKINTPTDFVWIILSSYVIELLVRLYFSYPILRSNK